MFLFKNILKRGFIPLFIFIPLFAFADDSGISFVQKSRFPLKGDFYYYAKKIEGGVHRYKIINGGGPYGMIPVSSADPVGTVKRASNGNLVFVYDVRPGGSLANYLEHWWRLSVSDLGYTNSSDFDSDGDGCPDIYDQAPNDDQFSNCNDSGEDECKLDSDGDGVPDCKDPAKYDPNFPKKNDVDYDDVDDRIDPYKDDNSPFSYRIIKYQAGTGAFTIRTERGDIFQYGNYGSGRVTYLFEGGSPWVSGSNLIKDYNKFGHILGNGDFPGAVKIGVGESYDYTAYGQKDDADLSVPDVMKSADQNSTLHAINQTNRQIQNLGDVVKQDGKASRTKQDAFLKSNELLGDKITWLGNKNFNPDLGKNFSELGDNISEDGDKTRDKLNSLISSNESLGKKIEALGDKEIKVEFGEVEFPEMDIPGAEEIGDEVSDSLDEKFGNSEIGDIGDGDSYLKGKLPAENTDKGISDFVNNKINSILPDATLSGEDKSSIDSDKEKLIKETGLDKFQFNSSSDCSMTLDLDVLGTFKISLCEYKDLLCSVGNVFYGVTILLSFITFMRS